MAVDYWAHEYFERPPSELAEDDEFDPDAIAAQWDAEDEGGPDDFEDIP